MALNVRNTAKPFVKWAGGKSQLLDKIDKAILLLYKKEGFDFI
ncbi:hypothetical protein [Riemerella columbina]|nr:hypothetical protein [Riemerella columbina]